MLLLLLFGVEVPMSSALSQASWSVGGPKLRQALSALLEGGPMSIPLDHCALIDVLLISCGFYWPHCFKKSMSW